MSRRVMAGKALARVRMLAAVAALMVAAIAVLGLSGCQTSSEPSVTLTPKVESGTTISDGTLTVGINAANSPYGGTNSSNETIGLDVDVAAALADELGLKLQIVDVGTDGRTALSNQQVDLVLGQTKPTAGQSTTVAYSDAYINDGASLFCLSKGAPKSAAGLDIGKGKVLVQSNTAAAYAVQESLGVDAVEGKSTLQEAFDALESGEQDYLVADAVIGDYYMRNYDDMKRVGFISSTSVTPVYATTLSSNTTLAESVNTAIDTIAKDGVLRVVATKWLGSNANSLLPGKVDISKLPTTAFGSQ